MAEEKESPRGISNTDAIGALVAILILFVIAQRVYVMVRGTFLENNGPGVTGGIVEEVVSATIWFKIFSVVASAILLAGILHTRNRFVELNKAENLYFYPKGASVTKDIEGGVVENRWQRIMEHVDSDNPNDWKVAILEADILLDELLDRLGYHGESMGEKMKQIEKSDFLTLDKAWEAHKIRNAIAHEGSQFLINKREVLRVMEMYKEVFDEFYYV